MAFHPATHPFPTASLWPLVSSAKWAGMEWVCGPSEPQRQFNTWSYRWLFLLRLSSLGPAPPSPFSSPPGASTGLAPAPLTRGDPSPQSRLVVKTALKLLLVFVEYSESNAPLFIRAVNSVASTTGQRLSLPPPLGTLSPTCSHVNSPLSGWQVLLRGPIWCPSWRRRTALTPSCWCTL